MGSTYLRLVVSGIVQGCLACAVGFITVRMTESTDLLASGLTGALAGCFAEAMTGGVVENHVRRYLLATGDALLMALGFGVGVAPVIIAARLGGLHKIGIMATSSALIVLATTAWFAAWKVGNPRKEAVMFIVVMGSIVIVVQYFIMGHLGHLLRGHLN